MQRGSLGWPWGTKNTGPSKLQTRPSHWVTHDTLRNWGQLQATVHPACWRQTLPWSQADQGQTAQLSYSGLGPWEGTSPAGTPSEMETGLWEKSPWPILALEDPACYTHIQMQRCFFFLFGLIRKSSESSGTGSAHSHKGEGRGSCKWGWCVLRKKTTAWWGLGTRGGRGSFVSVTDRHSSAHNQKTALPPST